MNDHPKLSIAEVHDRYRAEWVLLENPDFTAALEIQGGIVLWHSPNRDEVYERAKTLAPQHSAIVYTGNLPEDAAVVL